MRYVSLCGRTFKEHSNKNIRIGNRQFCSHDISDYTENILPEMLRLASTGKLKNDVHFVFLKDVESVWIANPASE